MQAERIRCDQSVFASMPGCGVSQIGGMIVDRDTDGLALDRSPIQHPLRWLAPNFLAGLAFAVDGLAENFFDSSLRVCFQSQVRMCADGEQSFFGVFKFNVAMGCPIVDQAMDPATFLIATKPISRLVGQQGLLVAFADP